MVSTLLLEMELKINISHIVSYMRKGGDNGTSRLYDLRRDI